MQLGRVTTATLALALTVAATAHAAPGGGSSSFGGGGGGGGGGFSGGGGSGGSCGSGCYTISGPWGWIIFVGFFVLFGLGALLIGLKIWRQVKHRKARVARIELAAAEAAQDDAYFEAAELRGAVGALHAELFSAWNDGDRERLRERLGADLMVEWERRLDDFAAKGWTNRCAVQGDTKVEYVGLTNRAEESEDRAVVRVSGTMHDMVVTRDGSTVMRTGSHSDRVTFAEYWTLGRGNGRWILLSIEQDAEGAHNLDAPIVASPWSDEARLHDEAVTELAVADAAPNVAEISDLDFDGDARAAALDLSNADGRFAPAVLEAAARRAVSAWAEAVDGDDAALESIATPDAVQALLYGGDASRNTRLVVRGPRLKVLRIAGLEASRDPPTMTVEAEVAGRRYVEDRDTAAVLQGSKDRETTFTERWTMALDGDSDTPWRIAAAA
jgi:predicted lipid-binding transport protein (Tim44 family)